MRRNSSLRMVSRTQVRCEDEKRPPKSMDGKGGCLSRSHTVRGPPTEPWRMMLPVVSDLGSGIQIFTLHPRRWRDTCVGVAQVGESVGIMRENSKTSWGSSVNLTITCDQTTSYPLICTRNHNMSPIFPLKLSQIILTHWCSGNSAEYPSSPLSPSASTTRSIESRGSGYHYLRAQHYHVRR